MNIIFKTNLSRYSYDPYQQSLNDNPEYELPLSSGDYVFVWGDADEVREGFHQSLTLKNTENPDLQHPNFRLGRLL